MNFDSQTIYTFLEILFLIPFLFEVNQVLFKKLQQKHSFFSVGLMNKVFFYHLLFGIFYYIYACFNPSDSHRYFIRPQKIGKLWSNFAGTETTFIDFLSYPFINYLGFSYEMMMLLFTWIGFLGFLFAYLFFRENITSEIKIFKRVDLLVLLLFLPNMHFWTASLGKGAPIFFGLMLFAYSITYAKQRAMGLVFSSILVFCIRPHMFLLLVGGAVVGILTGKTKINLWQKFALSAAVLVGLFFLREQILAVVKLNGSNNILADFLKFTTTRAKNLDNAGSGINMVNYSLPEKMFSFWFRPLFFDAPGILGVIVSIENFIYLLLFAKIFKKGFFKFIKNAPSNVKMSMVLFITTSVAMTFVMSNLGIIIRQKSMIMYFLFFVIYYYLAHEKSIAANLTKTTPTLSSEQKLANAA